MTKYLLAYHGGTGDGEKSMNAWMSWIKSMGPALTDMGNPTTGHSKTLAPGGKVSNGGSTTITGYSILEAPSVDKAAEMVSGCPQLVYGGTIEVVELATM